MYPGVPDERRRANLTAADCYAGEGLGVGAGGEAVNVLEAKTDFALHEGNSVIEIGCASLQLAEALLPRKVGFYGVDIHTDQNRIAEVNKIREAHGLPPQSLIVQEMDCSHRTFGFDGDQYDAAFCTETIEHLSNPYFMVARVKHLLKHGAPFVLAFPMPENNLGYGGGKHAHIYPGFLTRASFELFMKQLFFKLVHRHENGASAWYVFANYKGSGIIDAFSMTTGNYDDDTLFSSLDAYEPPFKAR